MFSEISTGCCAVLQLPCHAKQARGTYGKTYNKTFSTSCRPRLYVHSVNKRIVRQEWKWSKRTAGPFCTKRTVQSQIHNHYMYVFLRARPQWQYGIQVDDPPIVLRDVPRDDGALGRPAVPLRARRRADGESATAALDRRRLAAKVFSIRSQRLR